MADVSRDSESLYLRVTLLGLAFLLVLRIVFLTLSPLNLYADEAQYWRWGETLDWGYYSKPPMIAWVIHAVTALFGNDEWAVRLSAPFLHTIGAVFLFMIGRAMYGARTGMMAAFGYALMPGVILSSAVISPMASCCPSGAQACMRSGACAVARADGPVRWGWASHWVQASCQNMRCSIS